MTPLVTNTRTGWLVMSRKTLLASCGPLANVSSLANHSDLPPAMTFGVKFTLLFDDDEPARLIGCVDPLMPLSLSVKTNDAVRVPVAVGLNLTFTTHEAPGARLAPHALDEIAKSLALSPAIWRLLIARLATPMLVSVTGIAMLALPTGWLE